MAFLGGLFGGQKAPDYRPMAEAQKYAADLQHQASQRSIQAWEDHQKQVRDDYEPYRQFGLDALNELHQGLEEGRWTAEEWIGGEEIEDFDPHDIDIKQDPGYQFRLSEGLKAIRRESGARSGATSGANLKAINEYASNYASSEYSKSRDRAVQDYELRRQSVFDKRRIGMEDVELRQQLLNNEFDQRISMTATGLRAQDSITSAQQRATGEIATHDNAGAAALGAGRIGVAQTGIDQTIANNKVKQQTFDNMLGVASTAVGAYTGMGAVPKPKGEG